MKIDNWQGRAQTFLGAGAQVEKRALLIFFFFSKQNVKYIRGVWYWQIYLNIFWHFMDNDN